ncbi:MAG: enoyl-CoA hydratase-related protein [Rhodospirillaceae bacterium]
MTESILCQRDGEIATVVINRPEKRNALDSASWRRLGDVFEELSGEEALRCVIVTGAGGKAFGSGNDITEFSTARASAEQVKAYNAVTGRAIQAIENCLHPTVARIEGFCMGGGLEIALACDIRIATDAARFGLPVKNMGIFLDPALADTLVHAVGRAVALELVLEGRIYDAADALARGLVTRIVPPAALDEAVAETVGNILAGAPLAARFNKRAIRRVSPEARPDDATLEAAAAYGDTEDYHSAYRAFLEKKKADFRGR